MPKTKLILIIAIVIICFGVGFYFVSSSQKPWFSSEPVSSGQETSSEEKIGEGPLPPEILDGEIDGEIRYSTIVQYRIADPVAKKRGYDILVTKKIEREEVDTLARKIISKINEKDSDIDSILLLFYTNKDFIKTQNYDIAQVIWQPEDGIITSEIAEKNLRSNYEIFIEMAAEG